jgi:hypothetical protein
MALQLKVRLKEGFVKMADAKVVVAPKKADASVPTPAEKAAMQKQLDEAKQDAANQAGAKAAAGPNRTMKKGGMCMARGGGVEIRGKTKGRFV